MKTRQAAWILGMSLAGTGAFDRAKAEQLHVTVYDKANLPEQFAQRAADNLRLIFRQAEIEVEWVSGAPEADEATLVIYDGLAAGRDQEHRLACRARREIAVAIMPAAPSSLPQSVLGVALPFASAGLNVRVYRDRIAAAAVSRGAQLPEVLGHAIAHEIGHVLLRSSAHDGNGLMAGVWKAREYAWIATGSMFFTREQSKRMRATIDGIGCPSISSANE
jgi:hypothetical protein